MTGLSIWSLTTIAPKAGFEIVPVCGAYWKETKMDYDVNGTTIAADEEGYITNLSEWSKELADVIAVNEKIDMNEEHWEVVNFLRDYYEEYQIAPAVRVLIKSVKKPMGKEKGNNKYMYELFPYGPAKQACKIAGLPKPTGCV
jgi:tRNA 2-thiouridine synthesizing protein E